MGDPNDAEVADALTRLERINPAAAEDAEAALSWLTWNEGLGTLTQHRLQDFLWYELPTKWMNPWEDSCRPGIAEALGWLFDLLELPRYAGICRSQATADVLAAYERGLSDGLRAFQDARQRSGVVPPNLPAAAGQPALVWGSVMGLQEATAYESTAAALELAVASGDLRPGTRGWRGRQRQVALTHLTSTCEPLTGETLLDAVIAERIGRWVSGRGESRRWLIARIANHLLHHVPAPPGAAEAVEPLRWLLQQIGDGVALTQAYRLNRAFVVQAARSLGWYEEASPPRSEGDVPQLHELHALARRLGAVRRTGRRLRLTATGRELAAHPEALWRAVASQLAAGHEFDAAVAELALAALIDMESLALGDVPTLLVDALAGEGWRDRDTGEALRPDAISRALWALIRPAQVFGFLSLEGDRWAGQALALTAIGRAAGLVALRDRATAPMRDWR